MTSNTRIVKLESSTQIVMSEIRIVKLESRTQGVRSSSFEIVWNTLYGVFGIFL